MGSIGEPSKKPWIATPLIESRTLSQYAGCRIFLKLENLQPSSSFKSRGIGNLILTVANHHASIGSTRPLHFHSSSGGNAGLAAVTASVSLGHAVSVVVPESTEPAVIAKMLALGARDVHVHGSSWIEADTYLREQLIAAAEARGEIGVYVPPFDDERVWEGASTMVEEMSGQMPADAGRPDAVVCSVGGGGLLSGIALGLDRLGWAGTHILAMETHGADSLAQSVQQGQHVTLPGITSIATSLGATKVARRAYDIGCRKNVSCVVLDDAEAALACCRFADDERFVVEPACGVSVAVAYDGRLKKLLKDHVEGFGPESKVVIVVCGGSKISLETLRRYEEIYGDKARELGAQWMAAAAAC